MILTETCDSLILNRRLSILESELDNNFVNEASGYASILISESYDAILTEATTNMDMIRMVASSIRECYKEFKIGRKHLKRSEREEARKSFRKCLAIIDDAKAKISKIDDFSAGTKAWGNVAGLLMHFGLYIVTTTISILKLRKLNKENQAFQKQYNAQVSELQKIVDIGKKEEDKFFHGGDFDKIVAGDDADFKIKSMEFNKYEHDIKSTVLRMGKKISIATNSIILLVKSIKDMIKISKDPKGSTNLFRTKLLDVLEKMENIINFYIEWAASIDVTVSKNE